MKFTKTPTTANAIKLLHELAMRKPTCTRRKVDKPLALYGAGELGRMAKKYFDTLNIPVQYVLDTRADAYAQDLFWHGTPIYFPEELPAQKHRGDMLAVCVAKVPYTALLLKLLALGWKDIVPFYDVAEAYRDRHPLSNGWFANLLNSEDVDNIRKVLSGWNDDISRAHHLQFIAWRLLREEWDFVDAPINTEQRFFISEVLTALTDNESFLDVGAHNGGVSRRFMQLVNGHFKELIAIEPDKINLDVLRKNFLALSHEYRARLRIIQTVVGEKKERRMFYEGLGYASQLSVLGKSEVSVTTMDQIRLSPTFIKLHLEGYELAALKGAQETISLCRPIIAATSYHNHLGLWELPKWLMTHLDNYRFFLRLHSWCGTGAVVYAIPEDRDRLT